MRFGVAWARLLVGISGSLRSDKGGGAHLEFTIVAKAGTIRVSGLSRATGKQRTMMAASVNCRGPLSLERHAVFPQNPTPY